jgi:Bacterial dipeptidyl-peptidase Sh3 domain
MAQLAFDRRLTPATARVAHVSLKGKRDAPAFTKGEDLRIALSLVDLLRSPNGARERQLLLGESFTVIDRQDGHAFGFAVKDGYCGWLPDAALNSAPAPTHWVATPGTHVYPEARVQSRETAALSMGAQVTVLSQTPKFSETTLGFIPTPHLLPLGRPTFGAVIRVPGLIVRGWCRARFWLVGSKLPVTPICSRFWGKRLVTAKNCSAVI